MSGACSPLPSWKYTCVLPVQLHVFPASKALQHCLCNPQCSAQVSRGTVCAVSIQGRPLLQNNNPSIPLAWLVRQPHIGSSRGTLCLIEHSHSLSAFLPSSFWKYSLPCQYQICPCLPRPEMYQDLSCFSPFCCPVSLPPSPAHFLACESPPCPASFIPSCLSLAFRSTIPNPVSPRNHGLPWLTCGLTQSIVLEKVFSVFYH